MSFEITNVGCFFVFERISIDSNRNFSINEERSAKVERVGIVSFL